MVSALLFHLAVIVMDSFNVAYYAYNVEEDIMSSFLQKRILKMGSCSEHNDGSESSSLLLG